MAEKDQGTTLAYPVQGSNVSLNTCKVLCIPLSHLPNQFSVFILTVPESVNSLIVDKLCPKSFIYSFIINAFFRGDSFQGQELASPV